MIQNTASSQAKKGSFFRTHRRLVMIVGACALVLALIAGYITWSKSSWEQYEVRYNKWQSDTKSQIETVMARQSDTLEEQAATLQGFKDVATTMEKTSEGLCDTNMLMGWQRPFFSLKEREEKCQAVTTKLGNFRDKLWGAVVHLEDEVAIAKLLATAPRSDKEIEEKEWAGYVTGWKGVAESAKGMSVSAAFGPLKQKTVDTTAAIAGAWDEVVAASQAKDKARYTKAQQELAQKYDTLDALKEMAKEQMKTISSEAEASYKTAFST